MDNTELVKALTRAIALNEGGGKIQDKPGKTGEMASIFQYTPDTWKAYSKEIMGQEVPLDKNSETFVTAGKVKNWLDKGYTPEQVLSMWNAGPGEPNAYSGKFSSGQPSKGVNAKYGVPFDVPGYVKKGMSYLQKDPQLAQGSQQQGAAQQDPAHEQAINTLRQIVNKYSSQKPVATAQPQNGLMGQLMGGGGAQGSGTPPAQA